MSNIFIHGGNINIYSEVNINNEPINQNGNLTIFDGNIFFVGSKRIEYAISRIIKGNKKYAYYSKSVTNYKILIIKNENGDIVKQGNIFKTTEYIFYSSPDLNKNYTFYLSDLSGGYEIQLIFTFIFSQNDIDEKDIKGDDGEIENEEEKNSEYDEIIDDNDNGKILNIFMFPFMLMIILFFILFIALCILIPIILVDILSSFCK